MPSFTKLLALAAMAISLTTGFTIPPGQPDGLYIGNPSTGEVQLLQSYNSSGAPPARLRLTSTSALKARTIPLPVTDQGCPDAGLNVADYLGAYANFASYCNRGGKIPGRNIYFSTVGSAVWYGCSYGGEQPCDSDEASDAEARFNTNCGAARAAW